MAPRRVLKVKFLDGDFVDVPCEDYEWHNIHGKEVALVAKDDKGVRVFFAPFPGDIKYVKVEAEQDEE